MHSVNIIINKAGSSTACSLRIERRGLSVPDGDGRIVGKVGQDDALIESAVFSEKEGGHEGEDGEGDREFK